jgi:hypothetical protein
MKIDKKETMNKGSQIVAMVLILSATACGGSGGGKDDAGVARFANVQVSWAANRETAVNRPDGGYKVYYSKTPGFDIATASSVDAPFQSGSAAPTSAVLQNLSSGTYFVKVVAYSGLTRPGPIRTSSSTPSAEIAVTVP